MRATRKHLPLATRRKDVTHSNAGHGYVGKEGVRRNTQGSKTDSSQELRGVEHTGDLERDDIIHSYHCDRVRETSFLSSCSFFWFSGIVRMSTIVVKQQLICSPHFHFSFDSRQQRIVNASSSIHPSSKPHNTQYNRRECFESVFPEYKTEIRTNPLGLDHGRYMTQRLRVDDRDK